MKFPIDIWQRAFGALPLPRLMQKIGDGKHANKAAECPFCRAKGKTFGLFKQNDRHKFKCHKPGCIANDPPPDVGHGEIGYLVLKHGYGIEEAKQEFIKLALPQEYERIKSENEKRQKEGDAKCPPPTTTPQTISQPCVTSAAPSTTENAGEGAADGSTPPPAPVPPPPPANVVPFSPGPPPPSPPNPHDVLFRKIILTPRDRKSLVDKRGFTEETISALGFRSNNQSNRIHIESLKNDFPMELLLETGIYKNYRGGPAPNRQLLGWGLKRKAKKQGEEDQWDWTEPILIPYLDADGVCFHLRPHKGEIVGPPSEDDFEDEDEQPHCASHVYCPRLLAATPATIEGTAVLTEGEFKAGALFQCGIPVLAIPGVTFVRNPAFRAELIDLLRRFAITDLVIIFDNEVKDDPAFKSRYKADPAERYDTPMWAEYIAIDLGREHFGPHKGRVRIGMLPDNLREDGKADFDSVLSYFVRQKRDAIRGTNEAHRVFKRAINESRPPKTGSRSFPV